MSGDLVPGTLLGIEDANPTKVIVVPEDDPTKATDLLDALRSAGESGGVVLVGGWSTAEHVQWEDLAEAVSPLLVFIGSRDYLIVDAVLDGIVEKYFDGQQLAANMDTCVIGSVKVAARLRRGQPILDINRKYVFGPTPDPKPSRDRTPQAARPRVYRATELQASEQPEWLAKDRIPLSALSLLVGDEGIGKSLAWVWVCAAVTTGRALPEFGVPARTPADVLLVITEDDWSTTVRPRLEVAGADLDRVAVICTEADGSGAPTFPDDIDLVTAADPAPLLIVVDAWLDTVPGKLSVRDPQQARQALHPWKEVAVSRKAAVLLLTHTNRVASASSRDKYGATVELRKKARMALFAQRDDDGHLTIGPDKANTSSGVPASRFVIDAVPHFPATESHDGTVPLLRCIGQATKTATEMIADRFNGPSEDDNDVSGVRTWLRSYLMHEGRPVKSQEIKTTGAAEGFSARSLERAARDIHAAITRTNGFPSYTCWSLPAALSSDDLTEEISR